MSAPVQILMSKRAAGHFGEGVAQAMGERPHRIVFLEDVPADGSPCAIDVALLSRDVTGRSGKFKISEALEHFLDVLARSPNLAWIQTHSAGTDRPIWKPIKARGIRLTTSSGMATTVALSAVGGIIALARRFPDLADAQRRHAWEPLLEERAPRDLAGQVAVVAGLGPIGTEVARLLKAIGLRVIGIRRAAAGASALRRDRRVRRPREVPAADRLARARLPAHRDDARPRRCGRDREPSEGCVHRERRARRSGRRSGHDRGAARRAPGRRVARRLRVRAARSRFAAVGLATRDDLAALFRRGRRKLRPRRCACSSTTWRAGATAGRCSTRLRASRPHEGAAMTNQPTCPCAR